MKVCLVCEYSILFCSLSEKVVFQVLLSLLIIDQFHHLARSFVRYYRSQAWAGQMSVFFNLGMTIVMLIVHLKCVI